jgi:8-oxo-dGTP diphosphatase
VPFTSGILSATTQYDINMNITYDNIGWVHVRGRKVLCNRSYNKDTYYVPGGKREGDESDHATLLREMKEEMSVDLLPDTVQHVETFHALAHNKGPDAWIRLACYTADFSGELAPANEIEEIVWLSYGDKERTSPVSQLVFEHLKELNLID